MLETLDRLSPVVRPMFGCYAIYVNGRMVLILRDRPEHRYDNGVWLATAESFHTELKAIFPSLRSIRLLGGKTTAWQNIPASAEDFEESVVKACELIIKNDPRIGKIIEAKKGRQLRKR